MASANIDPADPGLLPRYDQAGELYVGLAQLDPPERLSLLIQLAEGTSDPELEPASVAWSCLDGEGWHPLGDGQRIADSTRGLINSGIIEFELPQVSPSARLPGSDLYWLRAVDQRNADQRLRRRSIFGPRPSPWCSTIAATPPTTTTSPCRSGSIERLVEPDAGIRAIEQPFTSFGGRPAERPEHFYTCASASGCATSSGP